MCLGLIGIVLGAVITTTNVIVFAKLTGSFAELSFLKNVSDHEHVLQLKEINGECPFGIEISTFNYEKLHK